MLRSVFLIVLGVIILTCCGLLAYLVQRKFNLRSAQRQRHFDELVLRAIREVESRGDLQDLRRDVQEELERKNLVDAWPNEEFVQMNPYQSEFSSRKWTNRKK